MTFVVVRKWNVGQGAEPGVGSPARISYVAFALLKLGLHREVDAP
jgi:hypothetical protein